MLLSVAQARKEGSTQIELMKGIAAKNPKDSTVRDSLAQMLVALQRAQEAEPYIEELLKLSRPSGEFYNSIAVLYSDMNQSEKAIEYYRKAAELKPHHVIYMSLAITLRKLGQRKEAYEVYQKAFEIKPDSIYVLKLYADFLRDEGKRQEALEMYKRAVAVEPTNVPVIFNLSALYAKTGNLALAKQYYEMLRMVDPAQARILNRLMRVR
jgi:tetratricopeptide (TPR) repeat protein